MHRRYRNCTFEYNKLLGLPGRFHVAEARKRWQPGKTEETRPTRGNTCHAFCVSCTRSTSIPVLFSLEESFSSFRYLQTRSPRDNLNNLLFSSFISWTMLHQSESWSCFQRCKSDCLEKLETYGSWGLVICAMKWDESMQRLWINGSISRFVKFNSLEHDRMWKLPFSTSFFPTIYTNTFVKSIYIKVFLKGEVKYYVLNFYILIFGFCFPKNIWMLYGDSFSKNEQRSSPRRGRQTLDS